MFALYFLLTVLLSLFGAYAVGQYWASSKAIGGWRRFFAWTTAILSVAGFVWCQVVLFAISLRLPSAQDIEDLGPEFVFLSAMSAMLASMMTVWDWNRGVGQWTGQLRALGEWIDFHIEELDNRDITEIFTSIVFGLALLIVFGGILVPVFIIYRSARAREAVG